MEIQQQRMLSQDRIARALGSKDIVIMSLEAQVEELQKELAQYKKNNVVEMKGKKDGSN